MYWENDIVLSRFYLWHNYQLVEGGQYFAQEVVIVVSVVDWILCIFHVFNRLDIPSGQIPIRYQMLGLKTKLEFDGRMCNEIRLIFCQFRYNFIFKYPTLLVGILICREAAFCAQGMVFDHIPISYNNIGSGWIYNDTECYFTSRWEINFTCYSKYNCCHEIKSAIHCQGNTEKKILSAL